MKKVRTKPSKADTLAANLQATRQNCARNLMTLRRKARAGDAKAQQMLTTWKAHGANGRMNPNPTRSRQLLDRADSFEFVYDVFQQAGQMTEARAAADTAKAYRTLARKASF